MQTKRLEYIIEVIVFCYQYKQDMKMSQVWVVQMSRLTSYLDLFSAKIKFAEEMTLHQQLNICTLLGASLSSTSVSGKSKFGKHPTGSFAFVRNTGICISHGCCSANCMLPSMHYVIHSVMGRSRCLPHCYCIL